jgi:hypothetical protein
MSLDHTHVFFASKNEVYERLNTCKNCEHVITSLKLCGICKCFIPTKALFATTSCPKKKWPTINCSHEHKKCDENLNDLI